MYFISILFKIKIHIHEKCMYVNSVYPDQMLGSAASDLGLHCLPR